jgi:membrane-associated phospholipid phosphatase
MLTGVLCLGLLVLVFVLAVWTPAGQRFEDAVLNGADRTVGSVEGARATDALDRISAPTVLLAAAVIVAIGFLRRRPLLGFVAVGVVAASIVTAEVVQHSFRRPLLLPAGYRREDQSFPSGHTAVAMSVMCALVLVTPYRFRAVVLLLTSIGAGVIEVAAVTASWHRPSDTLGSDLIALLFTCVALAVLARLGRTTDAAPSTTPGRAGRGLLVAGYATVAVLAFGVATVVAVRLVASRWHGTLDGTLDGSLDGSAFLAGRALALGGSATVALALLGLLRGVDFASAVSDPTKDRELAW